jgi:hypothetical protein
MNKQAKADWYKAQQMPPFHRFLIKNRIFCEHNACLKPAVAVARDKRGHERVYCEEHK